MSMLRRLSGIFSFYPDDSNDQYWDRFPSPEPRRGRRHYTSSSRTPKSPRQHYTQPHSPPADQAAIPEDPTERSDSPEGSKFSIVARESDIGGGDRETTTMSPERRNTVNRRQVAVPPEANVGNGNTSRYCRTPAKQSTVNSHEIWMDGSKNGGGKDTPQKDKQKEKDAYTSGNGTVLPRNESQELLISQIQTLEAQLRTVSEREYIAQSRVRELDEQNRTLQRQSMQDQEEIQNFVKTSTRSAEANARHIRELEQRGQALEEQVKKLQERAQKAETAAHAQSRPASTSSAPPTRRGTSSIPEVHHPSAERRAEEVFPESKADLRNKPQELLDVFKPSTTTSKGQTIGDLTAENQSLISQIQTLEAQLQTVSGREYIA